MDKPSLILGAPRDAATGEELPTDSRIPVSPAQGTLGAEEIASKIDDEQEETPEPLAPPAVPDWLPLPSDACGWIATGAPERGKPIKPWDGDPSKPIMPGEIVLYWHRSKMNESDRTQWSWLVPWLVMIVERLPSGLYAGVRFRPLQGGCFPVSSAAPSDVPRDGCFTGRRQFPPELCALPPW